MGICCLTPTASPIHLWTIPIANHRYLPDEYPNWHSSSTNPSILKTEPFEVEYQINQREWYKSKGFCQTPFTIYYVDLPLGHLVAFNSHTDNSPGVLKALAHKNILLPPSNLFIEVEGQVYRFEASDYRTEIYFVLTNKALLSFNPQNQFLSLLRTQKLQLEVFCCCLHKKKKRLPLVLLKLVSSFFFI